MEHQDEAGSPGGGYNRLRSISITSVPEMTVRKRPTRKPKDEELQLRLQNALVSEAQKDAMRERERRIAMERSVSQKVTLQALSFCARACVRPCGCC